MPRCQCHKSRVLLLWRKNHESWMAKHHPLSHRDQSISADRTSFTVSLPTGLLHTMPCESYRRNGAMLQTEWRTDVSGCIDYSSHSIRLVTIHLCRCSLFSRRTDGPRYRKDTQRIFIDLTQQVAMNDEITNPEWQCRHPLSYREQSVRWLDSSIFTCAAVEPTFGPQ